jgi:hypothetical protein
MQADMPELVVVTKGEKACDALREAGQLAVDTYGTGASPADEPLRPLVDRTVLLWPDNDDPGREHRERLAGRWPRQP